MNNEEEFCFRNRSFDFSLPSANMNQRHSGQIPRKQIRDDAEVKKIITQKGSFQT